MIKSVLTAPFTILAGDEFVLDTNVQGSDSEFVSDQYFCDNCKVQVTDTTDVHLSDIQMEWYPLNSMRRGIRLLICKVCRPIATISRIQEISDEVNAAIKRETKDHITGVLSEAISDSIENFQKETGN